VRGQKYAFLEGRPVEMDPTALLTVAMFFRDTPAHIAGSTPV